MRHIIYSFAIMSYACLGAPSAMAYDFTFSQLLNHAPQPVMVHKVNEDSFSLAKKFIGDLGDEAISIMAAPASSDQRQKHFRTLLNQNFDMGTIGRFTLGRYWRSADAQQQQEFQSLFQEMILRVYSKRFEDYSGQTMSVVGARHEGKQDILVNALVESPNGQNVRVDWRVRNRGSESRPKYKVIDVIVEGISMSLTQRNDFASIIQRGGGNVQALIDHLNK